MIIQINSFRGEISEISAETATMLVYVYKFWKAYGYTKSVQTSAFHDRCQTYLGMLLVDNANPQFMMSVHVIVLFENPHNTRRANSKST